MYMCDAICSIFSVDYLFLGKCLVSVQFPLPQSSIRWPVQGTGLIVKSHAFPGASHHTLALLPRLYWMFQREEILHIMNVCGAQLCSTCTYNCFVRNVYLLSPIPPLPPTCTCTSFSPSLSPSHMNCMYMYCTHNSPSSVLSPSSTHFEGAGGNGRPLRLSMSRQTSNSYSSLEQYAVSSSSIDSGNASMASSAGRLSTKKHKRGVCGEYEWCVFWDSRPCVCRISDSSAAVIWRYCNVE